MKLVRDVICGKRNIKDYKMKQLGVNVNKTRFLKEKKTMFTNDVLLRTLQILKANGGD